jgi:hypothetical protein
MQRDVFEEDQADGDSAVSATKCEVAPDLV